MILVALEEDPLWKLFYAIPEDTTIDDEIIPETPAPPANGVLWAQGKEFVGSLDETKLLETSIQVWEDPQIRALVAASTNKPLRFPWKFYAGIISGWAHPRQSWHWGSGKAWHYFSDGNRESRTNWQGGANNGLSHKETFDLICIRSNNQPPKPASFNLVGGGGDWTSMKIL